MQAEKSTGAETFPRSFPLPGSGAGILERLRGFRRYRIRLEGYAVILLMILVGFAGWHSGTNLLYLIFAMLISLLLVHGLTVSLLLRKIEIQRRLPAEAYAGRETAVTLILRNNRRAFSSYAVHLADHTVEGHRVGEALALRLLPRERLQLEYRTVFPRRGRYILRRIQLLTRFPFGLVEKGFSAIQPQEFVVYPALYKADEVAAMLSSEIGELEARRKGEGTSFYGLREYAPGDPARRIHWRSSARSQRLVVVEHERDELRKITLILPPVTDEDLAGDGAPLVAERFEQAISLCGSLARFFLEQDFEVQLITAERCVPHGNSSGHLHRILSALATLPLKPAKGSLNVRAAEGLSLQITYTDAPPAPGTVPVDARQWSISEGSFVRSSEA